MRIGNAGPRRRLLIVVAIATVALAVAAIATGAVKAKFMNVATVPSDSAIVGLSTGVDNAKAISIKTTSKPKTKIVVAWTSSCINDSASKSRKGKRTRRGNFSTPVKIGPKGAGSSCFITVNVRPANFSYDGKVSIELLVKR
jgi:hypothetical protein